MDLHFTGDTFTILQVSDPQDLQYVRKTMLRMLRRAYDTVKPDLVVLTGDNILGNHLWDARLISRIKVHDKPSEYRAMKKAIDLLMQPITERGLKFTMIFGNHDDRNRHTKQEQADIYRALPGAVGINGSVETGDCDTCNIPVYSADGKEMLWNLWLFDSAWYDSEKDKCFEQIKPQSVEWFKKQNESINRLNKKSVPSLLFLHIPLPATERLVEECSGNYDKAIEHKGKLYRLRDGVDGTLGEYPGVLTTDSGLFEAIKEAGTVKAVISGHDHYNCFDAELDGIGILQTAASSFRCYGSHLRGVRVITLKKDGTYTTKRLNYRDLCGNSLLSNIRYIWDADGCQKQKAGLIAGVLLAVAGVAVIIRALLG